MGAFFGHAIAAIGGAMTRSDPIANLLQVVPGYDALSDHAIAGLVRLANHVRLEPGDVLVREGEARREAFIVVQGHGDVFVDGEQLAAVGPGDLVGEMSLLDRGPHDATVRATTPMLVLVVAPSAFPSFLAHDSVARANSQTSGDP
jgi:CRP-like cAMP-binding protein